MQDSIDQERAQEYLDDLLRSPELAGPSPLRRSGADKAKPSAADEEDEEEEGPGSLSDEMSITRRRSEWALTRLYETDDGFRASVDELVPGAWVLHAQGKLGGVLADQLKGVLTGGGGGGDGEGAAQVGEAPGAGAGAAVSSGAADGGSSGKAKS